MTPLKPFQYTFRSESVHETQSFARRVAANLKSGDIVALNGDLAAGKTTFTQGLTAYFNIEEYAASPTFTYINEYHAGETTLLHIDAYRLNSGDELAAMGFWEYLESGVIAVIEWADIVADILPSDAIRITLAPVQDAPQTRQISLTSPREMQLT